MPCFLFSEINIERLTEVLILLYVSYKTSHHVSCIISGF